jgi:hypothetical protein
MTERPAYQPIDPSQPLLRVLPVQPSQEFSTNEDGGKAQIERRPGKRLSNVESEGGKVIDLDQVQISQPLSSGEIESTFNINRRNISNWYKNLIQPNFGWMEPDLRSGEGSSCRYMPFCIKQLISIHNFSVISASSQWVNWVQAQSWYQDLKAKYEPEQQESIAEIEVLSDLPPETARGGDIVVHQQALPARPSFTFNIQTLNVTVRAADTSVLAQNTQHYEAVTQQSAGVIADAVAQDLTAKLQTVFARNSNFVAGAEAFAYNQAAQVTGLGKPVESSGDTGDGFGTTPMPG